MFSPELKFKDKNAPIQNKIKTVDNDRKTVRN